MGRLAEIEKILMETDERIKKLGDSCSNINFQKGLAYDEIRALLMEEE